MRFLALFIVNTALSALVYESGGNPWPNLWVALLMLLCWYADSPTRRT
jgi:hypothetical protein